VSAVSARAALALLLVAPHLLAGSARAADAPIVAVFDLQLKRVRLSAAVLSSLSDLLATRLAASGAYRIVPRDRLKRELSKQKKASYKECYAQTCQIEIGQELAAQKSLASQIHKLGSKCVVTATLYDLKRAATERAATAEGACSEEGLMASLKQVVEKLASRGQSSAPAEQPEEGAGASGTSPGTSSTDSPPAPGEVGMVSGPRRARVLIEEFTDYQCPFCKVSSEAISTAMARFPGKVRHQHRDYPLDSTCNPQVHSAMHPRACRAAEYARCAGRQGRFPAMNAAIFAEQSDLSDERLTAAAKKAGLDSKRLEACLVSPATRKAILDDIREAVSRGVQGTPTTYVNGEETSGAHDAAWWEAKLEGLLKAKRPSKK